MRCKHCGHTIERDSKFCRHCGKAVAVAGSSAKTPMKNVAGKFGGKARIWAIVYCAWLMVNLVVWIAACFADSHSTGSRYFYPFGWSDYSSYDLSEFIVYALILPILVCVVACNWDWIKAMLKKDAERLKRRG